MALSIKNAQADQLARELAETTGETITDAVVQAIRERLERERYRRRAAAGQSAARIRRIQERIARLPVRDRRPPDEIIGYDEHGLPG
ncbi:MAG: type II toxin-antitoxin system VapB family antitoxin [Gemmatimonadales bacterium]